GQAQTVAALKEALLKGQPDTQAATAEALAKLGPDGVKALADAVRSADAGVRQNAVHGLTQAGPEGVPVLVAAVKDGNTDGSFAPRPSPPCPARGSARKRWCWPWSRRWATRSSRCDSRPYRACTTTARTPCSRCRGWPRR